MLSQDHGHAYDVDQEVRIIAILHFIKCVLAKPLQLNSILKPNLEASNLHYVKKNRLPPGFLNDSIVDCKEWQEAQVPELVLGGHDFVEGDECPCL